MPGQIAPGSGLNCERISDLHQLSSEMRMTILNSHFNWQPFGCTYFRWKSICNLRVACWRPAMPDNHPRKTAALAQVMAALGNTTRLTLVSRLSMTEKFAGQSISELAEGTGLTRQAVTKHLEILAEAGLVKRLKPGRATLYELNTEPVRSAIEALTVVDKQWARTQARLKAYVKKFLEDHTNT